jgi:tetratricopeptide (TPR) repeat protein
MFFQLGVTERRIANDKRHDRETAQKFLKDSISHLENAIKANQTGTTEPTYFNNLGLSFFESELYESAIDSYNDAITGEKERLKKDSTRSKENLSFYLKNSGLAYYHQGLNDAARDKYNEAIMCNPENADNYFNRGNVSLNQNLFEEALEDFDRAIARDEKNAKFYHAKGLAFQAMAEHI